MTARVNIAHVLTASEAACDCGVPLRIIGDGPIRRPRADCIASDNGDHEAAFRRYENARAARTARVTVESCYMWDVYHSDGMKREVYWQTLAERTAVDTFRCLAGFTTDLRPSTRSRDRFLRTARALRRNAEFRYNSI
jgi:hypothetical protein